MDEFASRTKAFWLRYSCHWPCQGGSHGELQGQKRNSEKTLVWPEKANEKRGGAIIKDWECYRKNSDSFEHKGKSRVWRSQ